ncbi:MAG: hypothetical protein AAFX78_08645 [Cyanobacteria bacterium J06638_20]
MIEVNSSIVRTKRCAKAFQQMFWAFIFFIDFRLGFGNIHMDILPDFIGWIVMASALTTIRDLSSTVSALRQFAYLLIVISLFDIVEFRIPIMQSANFTASISPIFFISIILAILEIVFIWKLCGLIMAMANAVGSRTIWRQANFRRKLYIAFYLSAFIVVLMLFAFPAFILPVIMVGLPLAVVVFALMMVLMRSTANMCRAAAEY